MVGESLLEGRSRESDIIFDIACFVVGHHCLLCDAFCQASPFHRTLVFHSAVAWLLSGKVSAQLVGRTDDASHVGKAAVADL